MNGSSLMKAALGSSQGNLWLLRVALFHSTPVLERRRQNHWQPRFFKPGRSKNKRWKDYILRDVNTFTEDLFQQWKHDYDHDDPPNRGPSWSRRQQDRENESRWESNSNRGRKSRKRFEFCDEEAEVETFFRSAFGGGDRFFFWSFVNEDYPRWGKNSSSYSNGRFGASWQWRFGDEEEDYDSGEDHSSSVSTSASDRLALGLTPSGPLKLEDVKIAYRSCALKYHPDRHQGASKSAAEEKFKLCTAAYQSLCDKLSMK